ncbi:hypothetical protein STTU_6230 [Streptomyces sp. Tu6071]|nr:hypothetical protein STTU_6230 [Streptomyces sp. Tu6071]
MQAQPTALLPRALVGEDGAAVVVGAGRRVPAQEHPAAVARRAVAGDENGLAGGEGMRGEGPQGLYIGDGTGRGGALGGRGRRGGGAGRGRGEQEAAEAARAQELPAAGRAGPGGFGFGPGFGEWFGEGRTGRSAHGGLNLGWWTGW